MKIKHTEAKYSKAPKDFNVFRGLRVLRVFRDLSPEYQRGELFGVEHLLCHGEDLFGGHIVDALEKPFHITLPPIVQETLPETQRKSLTGITRHTDLSLQLALGCREL